MLFENLSNKNPKDDEGCTPLHLAARNGHMPICKLIIQNENVKDIHPKCKRGLTPIFEAKQNGYFLDIWDLSGYLGSP